MNCLLLSWDVHLFLPLAISAPGSQAFRLVLVLTLLSSLDLRPSGLDGDDPVGFPGPPASRQPMMGLLGLHNC